MHGWYSGKEKAGVFERQTRESRVLGGVVVVDAFSEST